MKQRHTNGQLLSLKQRRTEAQMTKRSERAEYRSNIAKAIGRINFGLAQFLGRGIVCRFKWLLFER